MTLLSNFIDVWTETFIEQKSFASKDDKRTLDVTNRLLLFNSNLFHREPFFVKLFLMAVKFT